MWNLKRNYTNEHTKQKETHRPREQNCGCCREEIVRESGMDLSTLLYLKWVTSKDLLYRIWNSAQCYVAAWIGGEFGGEWMDTCISMAESLCCSSETITTVFVNQLYPYKIKSVWCFLFFFLRSWGLPKALLWAWKWIFLQSNLEITAALTNTLIADLWETPS